jgi:hypothetical protein
MLEKSLLWVRVSMALFQPWLSLLDFTWIKDSGFLLQMQLMSFKLSQLLEEKF